METAAFGVPHPDFGEGIVAAVVAAAGCEVERAALETAARARLARFKHPRRVVFLDKSPRNTMGKVQ